MNRYKITYFDFAGSRGEDLRLAMVLAGEPFDDIRVAGGDFPAMKPTLPFGALPVFEVAGGPVIAQTNAALRYIGRSFGLYPEDMTEAARVDTLMEAVEDLRHRIGPTMRITDPEARKAAREMITATYLPQWGAGVDALIGAGPFVSGAKPGVADVKLFMADRWISGGALDDIPATAFDGFAHLKTVARNFAALPGIAARFA